MFLMILAPGLALLAGALAGIGQNRPAQESPSQSRPVAAGRLPSAIQRRWKALACLWAIGIAAFTLGLVVLELAGGPPGPSVAAFSQNAQARPTVAEPRPAATSRSSPSSRFTSAPSFARLPPVPPMAVTGREASVQSVNSFPPRFQAGMPANEYPQSVQRYFAVGSAH